MSDAPAPQVMLWNSMTKRKEPLRAPEPGKPITMYVCGPTVHGRAHIGNARPAVVFDVLYRLLRHLHGPENVRYARNITDIDDKIMAKAVAENRTPQAVAAEHEAAYHADMAALGCLPPDFTPRATDHIAGEHGMIAMIAALIDRGAAYAADGHVLFEVAKYPGYGQLSRRPMEEMIAGARVEVAPYKRAPGDFVLWKPSRPDQPGWDSPWGRGRPGWHIECSAMIRGVLGVETIDIHGGGLDLQFPHHENERAQSCCYTGADELARIWMHNGFLTMGETKMSKSLGNIVTPRELLDAGWDGAVLRLALLSAHYRQPLKWDDTLLDQAKVNLTKLVDAAGPSTGVLPPRRETIGDWFIESLMDDLNTPRAVSEVNNYALSQRAGEDLVGATPRSYLIAEIAEKWESLDASTSLIGLNASLFKVRETRRLENIILTLDVTAAIRSRKEAKDQRDWVLADRIRADLLAQGILLEDHKDGTTSWRRA